MDAGEYPENVCAGRVVRDVRVRLSEVIASAIRVPGVACFHSACIVQYDSLCEPALASAIGGRQIATPVTDETTHREGIDIRRRPSGRIAL